MSPTQNDIHVDLEVVEGWPAIPIGVSAHLKIVNKRGEVVLDEDVNRVGLGVTVRWATWPKSDVPGKNRKAEADVHEISLVDLDLIEITPCSDRLKREPVGS